MLLVKFCSRFSKAKDLCTTKYISSFASDIMAIKSSTVYVNAAGACVCLTVQIPVMIMHTSHALTLRISGFCSYAMMT